MKSEEAEVVFHFDKDYREGVMDGNLDSWIELSVRADDTYIYGKDKSGVTGYADNILIQLLESVEAIEKGRKYIVEFEFGPTWLSIEPKEGNKVRIVGATTLNGAKNPEERLDIDISREVSQESWKAAVRRSSGVFINEVLKLNPELRSQDFVQKVQTKRDKLF